MHRLSIILSLLLPLAAAQFDPRLGPRAVNGRCTGEGGAPGVCVSTDSCSKAGGISIIGACPNDPDDVRCCTKAACASGGSCQWTSDCASGKTEVNLCPGPDNFKCCLPKPAGNGTGGQGGGGEDKGGKDDDSKDKPNLGEKILAKAKEMKGTTYVFGGGSCKGTTNGGIDCSGLVSWAICQVTGRDMFKEELRITWQMYCASEKNRKYKKVHKDQRRAGDAVFFGPGECDCSNGGEKSGVHHVGIMMNSKSLMWNALKTGTKVRSDDFGNWGEQPCPYVIRFE